MTASLEQQAVIDSAAPTILCLAGPGAGKSATLLARIERLLRDGVPANLIVVITYTNSAARELQDRLARQTNDAELNFIGTLHSWLLRLLTVHGHLIGLISPLSVVDEDGERELLLSAISEIAWKGSIKEVLAEIAKGPGGRQKPLTKVEIAAEAFFQKLAADKVLTFDMILFYGLRLLKASPSVVIADHILCDECQDWSDLDWRIIQAARVQNLFAVGDVDQQIFSFRGASSAFLNACQMANPDSLYKLESNYRCASSICDLANRLIANQPGRIAKQTISRTGQTGTVRILEEGFADDAAEAHGVAEDIWRQINFWELRKESFGANDCAVLCRTNFIAAQFRNVLKAHGLPVREKAKTDLPGDWPRAKASLALLSNPDNDRLAYVAIRLSAGQEKADEVRRRALDEYKTINALTLNLPADFTANDCGKALAKMGVSKESLERIGRFASQLPVDASISDLILLMGREDMAEDEGQGIAVLTGHSAKGREFRAVWLPAWEQEVIPGIRKDMNEAEERRLAYVMVTRAAEYLWISWAKSRQGQWGGPQVHTVSQFIGEGLGVCACIF